MALNLFKALDAYPCPADSKCANFRFDEQTKEGNGAAKDISKSALQQFKNGSVTFRVSARFPPPGLHEELVNNDRRRIVKMAQ
jgi:hypothetical protein